MNTLIRKSFLFFIAGLISFQFAFFNPQQAQAGGIDTVKSVLIQIESMVPNSPFPISIGEFFALLDLIQMCKGDTSDAGLMNCLYGASDHPTIGPLLEDGAGKGNLETALKIYIDIKNSDYVQLMIDGGKPIGCAAANIFTGVDVCGLLEELAAIAGAVGEAMEYAASWLEEIDVALFGQTPHMNQAMYYNERWRPFLKDYVEKSLKGSVSDDTTLTPHLNKAAFNQGGSYAEFGLAPRSVNAILNMCQQYYAGFKDDNGDQNCKSNHSLFKTRADIFVKQAKAIMAFTTLLEPSLANQKAAWVKKLDTVLEDLDAQYPGMGVKDPSKYPQYLWPQAIDAYKKNIDKKIGTPFGSEFCLNGDFWECIDLPKSTGMVYTMTYEAYAAFQQSNFQGDAADILTSSLEKVKPALQSYFDAVKKSLETYWKDKKSSDTYGQITGVTWPINEKIWALQAICKNNLKEDMSGEKYSSLCLKSEPLSSCGAKVQKIFDDGVWQMSDAQRADYLKKAQAGLDQCITAATTVVNEWKRMDKLKQPYIDGWSKYYADNFAALHNTPEKKNDVPKEQWVVSFQLANTYNSCVVENMKKKEAEVLATAGAAIQQLTGMSAAQLMNNSGINKVVSKGTAKEKAGSIFGQPGKQKIAEGFCASEGYVTANPNEAKVDGFGSGVAPPQPPVDPATRSKADKNQAFYAMQASGCTPYEWDEGSQHLKDSFHLMCDSQEKHKKCLAKLGAEQRPSKASCDAPYGLDKNKTYVVKPCCDPTYPNPFTEIQKHGVKDQAIAVKEGAASNLTDTGKKGLLNGVAGAGTTEEKDSNKFRTKNKFQVDNVKDIKEAEVDAGKAVENLKKSGGQFVEKAATVKVTPSILGSGGSVDPSSVQSIKVGERAKFKVKPNLGFKIKSVTGCGITGDPKEEIETAPVVTDCTLQITFENSKIQLLNNGGRPQAPGAVTPEKRTLPTVRPLLNQPLQRKITPLPPMPPVQEKQ